MVYTKSYGISSGCRRRRGGCPHPLTDFIKLGHKKIVVQNNCVDFMFLVQNATQFLDSLQAINVVQHVFVLKVKIVVLILLNYEMLTPLTELNCTNAYL